MPGKPKIRIGTSGWHYDHWTGPFYPERLPAADQLRFYSERLSTVEINSSFYRLPGAGTLELWRRTVPRGFLFAAKASRYITHMKKLKDPAEPVSLFMERISTLGEKLGPVLFQLPPRFRRNTERLRVFLESLPGGHRYAFEFRDRSWLCPGVYALLAEHGAALCVYELEGFTSPGEVTADFVYLRLHGPDGAYRGSYGERGLAGWAGAVRSWVARGLDVYCYFDNDEAGYAVKDALSLAAMTSGSVTGR